jgi:hypothetical protein
MVTDLGKYRRIHPKRKAWEEREDYRQEREDYREGMWVKERRKKEDEEGAGANQKRSEQRISWHTGRKEEGG